MTAPTTAIPARPRGRRWPAPLIAGAGLLTGLLLSGGTTFALWDNDDQSSLGQIIAGDLDISLAGETGWDETSSDVTGPQQDIDPAQFLARPGDTFRITQDFSTTLQGDNMLAGTSVSWADPAALPEGVSATYVVLDPAGTALTTVQDVGSSAELTPAASGNASLDEHYTLQIDLEFDVDSPDRLGSGAPQVLADLGAIVLDLQQTRTGEGFNS